jgi:hypothetical protein
VEVLRVGKYSLRKMLEEHPKARNIIGRSVLALSALAGSLYVSSCVSKDSYSDNYTTPDNRTTIEETVAPTYLTLDEIEKFVKDSIPDVYPSCWGMASDNYTMVNRRTMFHDNYILYSGEFPNDSQLIYPIPSKSTLLTLMYEPNGNNGIRPDNKKLIILSDGDAISDNLTSVLFEYDKRPLNGVNSIILINESEENAVKAAIGNYLKQPDRPRILVKDFPIIKELNCQSEIFTVQALGTIGCCRTDYDIKVTRLSDNKIIANGKNPLKVVLGFSDLLTGYNEIEIKVISPEDPSLTTILYIGRIKIDCPSGGGGGGGGGGCGSGPGGGHGG